MLNILLQVLFTVVIATLVLPWVGVLVGKYFTWVWKKFK